MDNFGYIAPRVSTEALPKFAVDVDDFEWDQEEV